MTAPDRLAPFVARLHLEGPFPDAPDAVARLLEDTARRCEAAGASVIGHLKCRAVASPEAEGASTPASDGDMHPVTFHCNLASIRAGAHCAGALVDRPRPVDAMELDLAVLVYGLDLDVVAASVTAALDGLRRAGRLASWHQRPGAAHQAPKVHDRSHSDPSDHHDR